MNIVLTAAFLIAIFIAFLYGFSFLRNLLIFVGAIAFYILNLSFCFNSSISTVVTMLILGIGLMLFWMYVRVTEEREQNERKEQDHRQGNLA